MSLESTPSNKKRGTATRDNAERFRQKKWRDSGLREYHGLCRSRIYRTWASMHSRCCNPNQENYPKYGGKGVTVCDRWKSFVTFLDDMGDPGPHMTIDRIDSKGPYSKENCRWATREEQGRNKSNNRLLTLNGITKCMIEWANEYGISSKNIHKRLTRGWDLARTLTEPLKENKTNP